MRNVPGPAAESPIQVIAVARLGTGRLGSEHDGGGVPNVSDTGGFRDSKAFMGRGLSLAFEFAGAVFLFWFAGRLVDNWLGIAPWAQIVGAVIGWIGGILHVYYAVQSISDRGSKR